MNETSYRESHLHKGADYHQTFSGLPHRRMMWELEKAAIRSIVAAHFKGAAPTHLDFACGTGRIISFLQPYSKSSTGVDISENMLAEARKNAQQAELFLGDITRTNMLGDRTFDLITAFRFFPNAEPPLRKEVINCLSRHMAKGGILVFNNHMNKSSLLRRLLSIRGYKPDDGMSIAEVRSLVEEAGLQITGTIPLGILPLSDRLTVGPQVLWRSLERMASTIVRSEVLAQDVLYFCQRSNSTQ